MDWTPLRSMNNDTIIEDRKITEIIDSSRVPTPPSLQTNLYAVLAIDKTSIDSIKMDIEDLNEVENPPTIANISTDSAKLATYSSKTDKSGCEIKIHFLKRKKL